MRGGSSLAPPQCGRCCGFTLVETMVVGVLVLLLATMAAPSFIAWQARDRVDASTRALLSTLALARSEAIRRGEPIVVCRSDAKGRCVSAQSARARAAADWSGGWAVFEDARERASSPLRVYPGFDGIVIRGAGADVRFTPPAGQVIGGFRSFEIVRASEASAPDTSGPRRCIAIAAGGRAHAIEGGCRRPT